jgi:NarL family two-component system sensor histidine kinase LiaS
VSATSTSISGLPRESGVPKPEPMAFRLLQWGVSVPVILLLVADGTLSWNHLSPILIDLGLWMLLVFVSDLMPVPLWGDVVLAMSLPVLLAAGIVFSPLDAAIVAFLGSADIREFRRETTLGRAVYNRSQVAVSVFVASSIFHGLGGNLEQWPAALFIAAAALIADFIVNAVLVAVGVKLMSGLRLTEVIQRVNVSSPRLIPGYACFGLIAVLLATALIHVGNWALVGFLIPVLLAQQMFSHGRRLQDASADLASKSELLRTVPEQIQAERMDERLVLAGELHDEVLQPLYKVHLMAQVLRQDLAAGKLFDLDDDLPELLRATESASSSIRALIRGLRRSSTTASDLQLTLRLLLDELRSDSAAVIEESLQEIWGPPELQLLAYQIAREAAGNAVKHAAASHISLAVFIENGEIRVQVSDDGHGFDVSSVDRSQHFGLQLMRERTESSGGLLHLRSGPAGTVVVARLPIPSEPS